MAQATRGTVVKWIGLALLLMGEAACSRSLSTAVVRTPNGTAPGTAGPGTTVPPALTPAPTPTLPPPCVNAARYLEDLTVPDGTIVAPGERIDKRWSVENSGSCDWGSGYRLLHVGGEGLTGVEEVALFPARAGSTAVWQVELLAPLEPGEYMSQWQARAPDGSAFGDVVFVIVVVAPPSPTP